VNFLAWAEASDEAPSVAALDELLADCVHHVYESTRAFRADQFDHASWPLAFVEKRSALHAGRPCYFVDAAVAVESSVVEFGVRISGRLVSMLFPSVPEAAVLFTELHSRVAPAPVSWWPGSGLEGVRAGLERSVQHAKCARFC
jgi:hypothetical protein